MQNSFFLLLVTSLVTAPVPLITLPLVGYYGSNQDRLEFLSLLFSISFFAYVKLLVCVLTVVLPIFVMRITNICV